jgi:hypothetical protein
VSRLPDIQEAFQRFLLTGDDAIASHVVGTQRVPVDVRLGIYGGGYRSRLAEALQSTFPVLATLLGEGDFDRLAYRYIDAHPSTVFSIRYYGDALAEFLAAESDYSRAPLLAELARWEWAMAAAFDAADAQPIGTEALGQIPPEDWADLRFDWSASVQVLGLEWNVPELWKAVTEGAADHPEPSLQAPPASWLIWRRDLQIYFRLLSPQEAALVAASRAGHSFGELCVALCEHLEETAAARQAAGFLRGWVESGLIVRTWL